MLSAARAMRTFLREWRVLVGLGLAAVAVAAMAVVWLAPRTDVPTQFWLLPLDRVYVGDREIRVVRVDYGPGLRGVSSLGGLDAALFVLDGVASPGNGMGMDGVIIPLDVVFFAPDGRYVERFTMPICESEPCQGYVPPAPWQFALEGPAGSLAWVSEEMTLRR